MSNEELSEIKEFYGTDLIGYRKVGKGKLRRVITFTCKKVDKYNKITCTKTIWRYPDRIEWQNIFMVLGGSVGELPDDIIEC